MFRIQENSKTNKFPQIPRNFQNSVENSPQDSCKSFKCNFMAKKHDCDK